MTRKKIAIALGILSLIGFLKLRWIQHTATEADDRDHPVTSAETPAAVAHVKRGRNWESFNDFWNVQGIPGR